MKTIVTHQSPDLDALASVWLIRKYRRGWKEAEVVFVPSGSTLDNEPPDDRSAVMHVDTGFGNFDHHQTPDYTCATKKVFEYLCERGYIKQADHSSIERIVEVVNRYDHFREVFMPQADDDIFSFSLAYVIFGLRANHQFSTELVTLAEQSLDGIMHYMKGKIHAEHLIEKGTRIKTYWGDTLVLETDNDFVMKVAFMKGFDMVIRHSPHYGNVSIKVHPHQRKKLKKLHKALSQDDPGAQWFYHASGRMLLNASNSHSKHMVTKYSLEELTAIISKF